MSAISEVDIKDMAETQGISLDATLNERGSRYGTFQSTAAIIQMYKRMTNGFLTERDKTLGYDQQEALDMIFHKIARIINGDPNYADSWLDIAGYAMLISDRLNGKVR